MMWNALWNIWLELSPWLLLGAAAAGLMHVLVPASWMKKHLTGRMGVLKAVLIGVPLPLCSCGVIPVGLGLRKSGASHGASVGFLISTPQTGVDSVLVSASFLGWPFALLKVAAALVTGWVGGTLADATAQVDSEVHEPPVTHEKLASGKWRDFWYQSVMLIQSIWGWLVVGVIVSAVITWLVPEQSLAKIPALTGLSALLLTLLISLPLYICATASVPIAAALVVGGLPPGAALVFLMAGPATNVATLGAVYRTLGGRSLMIYLLTIVTGSLVAGLAFNELIVVTPQHLHAHDHVGGWWRILSAVVLAVMIAWFAWQDASRWVRHRLAAPASPEDSLVLKVDGMTCNGCAATLERSLEARADVQSAVVSFDTHSAVVYGTASREELARAVADAGFVVSPNEVSSAISP